MLLSMTGFGEATSQQEDLTVSVEIRAVNNRYLKLSYRANDPYQALEPKVEKVVRESVRRGSLNINLRCRRKPTGNDYLLNAVALESYIHQLQEICDRLSLGPRGDALLTQVLAIPGIIEENPTTNREQDEDWRFIESVLRTAVERLQEMRVEEGRAMGADLLQLRDLISAELLKIQERAPTVVEDFRARLQERVQSLLQTLDIELDQNHIIREVALFADRSDISEEIVRLQSHLSQFGEMLQEEESVGRKLEFLTQEMGREANTIGSKANDVQISKHVVEIKGALEKIREMIQNIE